MKTLRLRNCGLEAPAALLASAVLAARAATLTVEVEPVWRGRPLAPDTLSVTNAAGEAMSVSRLAMLASGFRLRRDGGGWVETGPAAAFLDPLRGRRSMCWTNAPEGEFLGLEFCVGLPPALNHAPAEAFPAGHPLNPGVNGLHWSWQGGYVFLAVEGAWKNGGEESGYAYHLATDPMAAVVQVPAAFQVSGDTTILLQWDVARLWDAVAPISLAEPIGASTHSASGDSVAVRLKANLTRSWTFSGVRLGAEAQAAQAAALASKASPSARLRPWVTPKGFPRPALPADNPVTEEGVALGRRLFFDPRLSVTGRQSCADCHRPEAAFADPGRAVSPGADGSSGVRNAMSLANLAWQGSFFWDGRTARLRDQALQPIQNPREMGETLERAVAKVAEDPAYPQLFAAAFRDGSVTAGNLGLALEQFLLTLVEADSQWDRAMNGEATLTAEERRGFELFTTEHDPGRGKYGADCFHCHGGPLLSDFGFHNNGVDLPGGADAGRALATGLAADRGKFKTPSLRNVALTGPYMHDGRFATLEEVVAHYDHGIRRSETLDPNLAKHPKAGLGLSAADQRALVAFLKTLTSPDRAIPAAEAAVARPSAHGRPGG